MRGDGLVSSRRLGQLFLVFLRIGAFTFGGGMAMIPLMHEELVVRRGLVNDDQFVEAIALAQCAPGPIAGNLAVLLGYRLAGWIGAGTMLLGVALPAFLVITVIAANYAAWRSQSWASEVFGGLRPAVVVLVASAALRIGRATLRDRVSWGIFAVAAALLIGFRLHPVVVVAAAGGFSVWWAFRPGNAQTPGGAGAGEEVGGGADRQGD
jgi:chromate transporter